ncbi:MAG: hypothetical protein VCD16_00955 [Planctomycetota bacterium]
MAKVADSIGVMDGVMAEEQDDGVDLRVEREDIRFFNSRPDTLKIEITVHNRGYVESRPDTMFLEAAPLGAFVPWRPLQRLQVPAIPAGESLVVSTEARLEDTASTSEEDSTQRRLRRFQAVLEQAGEGESREAGGDEQDAPAWVRDIVRRGGFEGLSAWDIVALASRREFRGVEGLQQLFLTALEGETSSPVILRELDRIRRSEEPESSFSAAWGRSSSALLSVIQRARRLQQRRIRDLLSGSDLSAMDPSRAAGRLNRHWAGNINVHLSGRAVERHQGRELRCYPGYSNWALFNLGSRKGEEYRITFEGCGADWDPRVFHLPNAPGEDEAMEEMMRMSSEHLGEGVASGGTVVTPTGSAWMTAAVSPPRDATVGKLDIGILELSSGRETTVEFGLNANAPGLGLYTF